MRLASTGGNHNFPKQHMQGAVNRLVAGSNPARGAKQNQHLTKSSKGRNGKKICHRRGIGADLRKWSAGVEFAPPQPRLEIYSPMGSLMPSPPTRWCALRESNSHPFRDQFLKLARLPFRQGRRCMVGLLRFELRRPWEAKRILNASRLPFRHNPARRGLAGLVASDESQSVS